MNELASKSNWPWAARVLSVLIVAVFAFFASQGVASNSSSIEEATVAFIDSGSVLLNVEEMVRTGDINQNRYFHFSAYGWPYNLVVSGVCGAYQFLTGSISEREIVLITRSITLIFSIAFLALIAVIFDRMKTNRIAALLTISFIATWPSFVKFSYEIKPEALGGIFAILSILFFAKSFNRLDRYFFLSCSLAVAAMLSKQPYLAYIFAPAIMGVWGVLQLLLAQNYKQAGFVAMYGVGAVLLPLILLAPHILFDFGGFLNAVEAHRGLQTPHTTDAYTALIRWTNVSLASDQWLLYSVVLAIWNLFHVKVLDQNFRGLLYSAAIATFAMCAVLVFFLSLFFLENYFYPALPAFIINIIVAFRIVELRYKASIYCLAAGTVAALVSISTIYGNAIISASNIVSDAQISKQSRSEFVRAFEREIEPTDRVVVSPILPFQTDAQYSVQNTWQFSVPDRTAIVNFAPTMIIIDTEWPYSEAQLWEEIATELQLVREDISISGIETDYCPFNGGVTRPNCMANIRNSREGSFRQEVRTFAIYREIE